MNRKGHESLSNYSGSRGYPSPSVAYLALPIVFWDDTFHQVDHTDVILNGVGHLTMRCDVPLEDADINRLTACRTGSLFVLSCEQRQDLQ